jgi:hypothetical protein
MYLNCRHNLQNENVTLVWKINDTLLENETNENFNFLKSFHEMNDIIYTSFICIAKTESYTLESRPIKLNEPMFGKLEIKIIN